MSVKIAKTIHLSAAQWRILVSMMRQISQSSSDPSVARVADMIEKVALS